MGESGGLQNEPAAILVMANVKKGHWVVMVRRTKVIVALIIVTFRKQTGCHGADKDGHELSGQIPTALPPKGLLKAPGNSVFYCVTTES